MRKKTLALSFFTFFASGTILYFFLHANPRQPASLSSIFDRCRAAGESWFGPQLPDSGFDILIVAGQSNAVGAGMGDDQEDPALLALDSRIFQIGRYSDCDLKIIPATPSLQFPLVGEHWPLKGLSLPFARLYVQKFLRPGRNVLIVPAAVGATGILSWTEGAPTGFAGAPANLYEDLLMRARVALSHPDSRVVGILWHQGETDIQNLSSADLRQQPAWQSYFTKIPDAHGYEQQVEKLITAFRHDFPGNCVPFIAGEPVPKWGWNQPTVLQIKTDIKEEMRRLASGFSCVSYVGSEDLLSNTEALPNDANAIREAYIHFSASAMKTYGERYFAEFEKWKAMK